MSMNRRAWLLALTFASVVGSQPAWADPPLIYSNSGDPNDPYRITRFGGQCNIDGDATDLQTALGLSSYGFGCQAGVDNAVADDFVLVHGYVISQISFYLYQSGATQPSIASVNYAITPYDLHDELPPPWTTATPPPAWTDVYKKIDLDGPTVGCTRRIQKVSVTLSPAVALNPATYWLAWQATGSSGSGPFQAPVVIPGATQKPGANALQSSYGDYFAPLVDQVSNIPQDLIFELRGYRLGDMNCDGSVDFLDINPIVLYLSDFAAWQTTYPDCPANVGDINADGTYGQGSLGDINPFVALFSGGQ
jgi:hypothetical protein